MKFSIHPNIFGNVSQKKIWPLLIIYKDILANYLRILSTKLTISQNTKKIVFHRFQNIAHIYGPKDQFGHIWGILVLTRNNPSIKTVEKRNKTLWNIHVFDEASISNYVERWHWIYSLKKIISFFYKSLILPNINKRI